MPQERYSASVASVLDGKKIFGADESRDNFGERLGVIMKKSRTKFDKLAKSPKFRHACEGRHPELFENAGFPPSRE